MADRMRVLLRALPLLFLLSVQPTASSARQTAGDLDWLTGRFLASKGLARRIVRIVPSFQLALPIVLQSDLITTMPERNARLLASADFVVKPMPVDAPPLAMKLIGHPAHRADSRADFIKMLLLDAMGHLEMTFERRPFAGPDAALFRKPGVTF